MAVWSKVQGSPKSWSKLKWVNLNCVFQSVWMCCAVHTYEWGLPGYIEGVFMQGVDYDFSKSFCDLEPTRWECNSVQLLCCLGLNKQACTQPRHRPTWTCWEQRNPEQKIAILASLKEAHDVLNRREGCWSWPPGTKGFDGVMCVGRTREMYGWRWRAGICDGGEVLVGLRLERVWSQSVETGLRPQISPCLLSQEGLRGCLTLFQTGEWCHILGVVSSPQCLWGWSLLCLGHVYPGSTVSSLGWLPQHISQLPESEAFAAVSTIDNPYTVMIALQGCLSQIRYTGLQVLPLSYCAWSSQCCSERGFGKPDYDLHPRCGRPSSAGIPANLSEAVSQGAVGDEQGDRNLASWIHAGHSNTPLDASGR